MITPHVKVELFAKQNDGTYPTTGVELNNFGDFTISQDLGKTASYLNLQCLNYKTATGFFLSNVELITESRAYERYINIDDKIRVYAWTGFDEPITFDGEFVFDGVVNEIDEDKGIIILKQISYAEMLLKTILPCAYLCIDVKNTAPEIIQDVLLQASRFKMVYWDTDNPTSGYKSISYSSNYKRVYDIISDLSADKYTGMGDHYFYVRTKSDGKNYLVWRKRENSEVSSLAITEGESVSSASIQRGVWDVINSIIAYCGTDPYGRTILTSYFDWTSYAKYGGKWKYLTYDYASAIISGEKNVNTASFDKEKNYPTTGVYPYTTYFKASATDSTTPAFTEGASVVCTTVDEFVEAIRKEAKYRAQKDAKKICDQLAKAIYKVKAELCEPTLAYKLGYIIKCDFKSFAMKSTNLRVVGITQSFISGWTTTLQLEQDWLTATYEE